MAYIPNNAFEGELNLSTMSRMATVASFGIGREAQEDQMEVLMRDLEEAEEKVGDMISTTSKISMIQRSCDRDLYLQIPANSTSNKSMRRVVRPVTNQSCHVIAVVVP